MTRPGARRAQTAKRQMAHCVQLAREARRNSWQEPLTQRSEYRQISHEAMEGARYWRDEIRKLDRSPADEQDK